MTEKTEHNEYGTGRWLLPGADVDTASVVIGPGDIMKIAFDPSRPDKAPTVYVLDAEGGVRGVVDMTPYLATFSPPDLGLSAADAADGLVTLASAGLSAPTVDEVRAGIDLSPFLASSHGFDHAQAAYADMLADLERDVISQSAAWRAVWRNTACDDQTMTTTAAPQPIYPNEPVSVCQTAVISDDDVTAVSLHFAGLGFVGEAAGIARRRPGDPRSAEIGTLLAHSRAFADIAKTLADLADERIEANGPNRVAVQRRAEAAKRVKTVIDSLRLGRPVLAKYDGSLTERLTAALDDLEARHRADQTARGEASPPPPDLDPLSQMMVDRGMSVDQAQRGSGRLLAAVLEDAPVGFVDRLVGKIRNLATGK